MQVTLWEPMVGKATIDMDMIGRCSEARRIKMGVVLVLHQYVRYKGHGS